MLEISSPCAKPKTAKKIAAMSMFGSNKGKDSNKGKTNAPSTSGSGHSLNSLVQGTIVEGDVSSKNDIRIDGMIKGSLRCEAKVIVGPSGAIEGQVTCQSAVFEGSFEGELTVKELLTIKESAKVSGQVRYGKLVVQPGAVLAGDVRMNGQQPTQKTKPVAAGREEKETNKKATAER
jgi:cytoskeletal protein CcmA (bactofilin family)